jgi:hypothetical protein
MAQQDAEFVLHFNASDAVAQAQAFDAQLSRLATHFEGAAKPVEEWSQAISGAAVNAQGALQTFSGLSGAALSTVTAAAARARDEFGQVAAAAQTGAPSKITDPAPWNELSKGIHKSEENLGGLEKKAHESESAFGTLGKALGGAFGGAALIGGGFAAEKVLDGLFEKGQENAKEMDKLSLAFNGNSVAAKEASETADRLASKYAIMPDRLKEISANAGITANATGIFNEHLTELAGGLEKMNVPGVDATSVVKAFTAGAGDPEGVAGLGRLTKAFPILASGLAGITDPAKKAEKALELLGPKFGILAEQAQGPGQASEQVKIALDKFEKGVGGVFFDTIGTYVLPAITFLVDAATAVAGVFDSLPGPLQTAIKVIGGVAFAIGGVVAATTAWTFFTNLSLVTKARELFLETALRVQKLLGIPATEGATFATVAQTIATSALAGAMAVLTSPITIIIGVIALLVGAAILAYKHFTAFHDLVDKIGSFLKGVFNVIIAYVTAEYNTLVGAVNVAIAIFQKFWEALKPIRDAIGGVISGFKSLIGYVDDTDASTKALTVTAKESGEKQVEAIHLTVEELKAQQAQIDAVVAGYNAIGTAAKTNATNAATLAAQYSRDLKNGFDLDASGAQVKLTDARRKYLEEQLAIQQTYAKQQAVTYHQNADDLAEQEKIVGLTLEKAKQGKIKTYSEEIAALVTQQKQKEEINQQTISATVTNLRAILDGIKGSGTEELKARAATSIALESEQKKLESITKAAQSREVTELAQHLKAITEQRQLKLAEIEKFAIKEALSEQQKDALIADADAAANEAVVATIADNEKKKLAVKKAARAEELRVLQETEKETVTAVTDSANEQLDALRLANLSVEQLNNESFNIKLNQYALLREAAIKAQDPKELKKLEGEELKTISDHFTAMGLEQQKEAKNFQKKWLDFKLPSKFDLMNGAMTSLEDGLKNSFKVINNAFFTPLDDALHASSNVFGSFVSGIIHGVVQMGEQIISQLLLSLAAQLLFSSTTSATMASIAAGAATAAALVSIATLGGAALAGGAAVTATVGLAQGLAVGVHEQGGLVNSPMLTMVGEGWKPEFILPEKTADTILREKITNAQDARGGNNVSDMKTAFSAALRENPAVGKTRGRELIYAASNETSRHNARS